MPESVSHCPLCGHTESDLLDTRPFRGAEVRNRVCRHCGFVFQSPRMTPDELNRFYAHEYRVVYQGDAGPTGKDLFVQTRRAEHAAGLVAASTPAVRRHLDIGSSAGLLLQAFQARFNCEITGVEPGEQYRIYAEKQGIRTHASLEALAREGVDTFDVVSMMHVLEHLPDPTGSLVEIRENFLDPDGLLLIEVPNLYGHDSFETAHMSAFSPHTLRAVLEKAGFVIVQLVKHGIPRSKILPLYLTVLARPAAQPAPGPVRPERLVALKRRTAMLVRRMLQRLRPGAAWLPMPKE